MNRYAAVLLILSFLVHPAFAGNCSTLYRRQAVVVNHGYVAQAVVQHYEPYAVVSQSIQDKARAQYFAELVAKELAPKLQAIQAVKQPIASTNTLSAKCAKCHNASNDKGGVILDGSQAVDDATFRSIVKMLGTGEGVPSAMKGVIAGLKPEEKGSITEELLNLENVSQPQEGVLE